MTLAMTAAGGRKLRVASLVVSVSDVTVVRESHHNTARFFSGLVNVILRLDGRQHRILNININIEQLHHCSATGYSTYQWGERMNLDR